jgi:hypothetical protein
MIVFGIIAGLVSLFLVSNQFGNTDSIGIILFGCAGCVLVTGICHFFLRFLYAAIVGVLAAPLLIVLLFILFQIAYWAPAFQNRHHQNFAANGVSQIQPSKQMDELYEDCRHYITYGQNNTLFNSVAYFGDRYELTMQVPVDIKTKDSGSIIGKPKFYLHEVESVSISPTSQVGATFSEDFRFDETQWKKVYDSGGDFSLIGFTLKTTPVANFQRYADASRPSN